jgi:hypothetical protein
MQLKHGKEPSADFYSKFEEKIAYVSMPRELVIQEIKDKLNNRYNLQAGINRRYPQSSHYPLVSDLARSGG